MTARTCFLLAALLAPGCSRGGIGPDGDAQDLFTPRPDDDPGLDFAGPGDDLRGPGPGEDLRGAAQDLRAPADLAAPAEDMTWSGAGHVDIYVDNFCKMDVVPKSFTVPRGQKLTLTYYNRSRDYEVDVWLSYGGGFLDLAPFGHWADRFEHCAGVRPSKAYADITTACSSYRLPIDCP